MQRILKSSECKLLGGLFSYCIQLFLGITALSSLVYKRHIERPQREWKIWAYDVGKQLIGGFFIHFANIFVSDLLKANGDECAFYFLNFFIDCTFGIGIVYIVHDGICYIIKTYWNSESIFSHIGEYGNPPKIKIWLLQISLYLFALLINKTLISLIFYGFQNKMVSLGNWLFGPLQQYPNIELVIVMILCPWLLNTFQMWIFDYILKSKNNNSDITRILNENGENGENGDFDYTIYTISSSSSDDESFKDVSLGTPTSSNGNVF